MSSVTSRPRIAVVAREAGRLDELASALAPSVAARPTVTFLIGERPDSLASVQLLVVDGEVAAGDLLALVRETDSPGRRVVVADRVGDLFSGVLLDAGTMRATSEPRPLHDILGAVLDGPVSVRGDSIPSPLDMLSKMSHELRTPLNAILGFAQVLELDQLSDDQSESVHEIISAGRHLLAMINEVLEITRIESGRLSFSQEDVSLLPAIGEACELVRQEAAARELTVTAMPLRDVPEAVVADRSRLRQVLLELLQNAVRYSVAGGEITVTASRAAGGRVRIAVSDSGPGISPSLMERLFTPFDRLGVESSGVAGIGLGLSIASRIAAAMGGALGVDSAPGQGTTAWVELPEASPGPPATAVAARTVATAERTAGAARFVLYIEDNPANAALVRSIVRRLPACEMLHATDGEEGLRVAAERSPAMILLDLNLPDIQGEEVLSRLRADETTAEIPVVVISADATEHRIHTLRSMGVEEYLTKPIDVERLRGVLEASCLGIVGRR